MTDLMPKLIDERTMSGLEASGDADVLYRNAAEFEFEKKFLNTRGNQLVAKVTVTKYYKHTQFGYEEIPQSCIRSSS